MDKEKSVPHDVVHLVRFLCETWSEIDKWAYCDENLESDSIMYYPVIQGVVNQINLKKIGSQKYDNASIYRAILWMLESEVIDSD